MQLQALDYGTPCGFLPILVDSEGYATSQGAMDLTLVAIFFTALNTYGV